jgi:tRNA A-37 threonylcarbamoyl transferase component Bud32
MFKPGDAIDAWIVERTLGAGGMGSVYLCRNRAARRIRAAVKVLDARLDPSPRARARFVREAELLFSIDHPHIVKVRNVRMDASPPYLEMAFVEGPSLDDLLADGPLHAGDAAVVAAQVAEALAYIHARGVFHRDVKPGNIVLQGTGAATLVDFGIAAEVGSSTVSEAGQAIGSAVYVPPEWLGGAVDPARWDLYALGVVLYEMLAGHAPDFSVPDGIGAAQRFLATLSAKQGSPPLDPDGAPDGLRDLVRSLTAPDPAARPTDASGVAARLRALVDLPRDPGFVARCAPREVKAGVEAAPASAPSASSPASTWAGDVDEAAVAVAADEPGAAVAPAVAAPDGLPRVRQPGETSPPGSLPVPSRAPEAAPSSRVPVVVAGLAVVVAAMAWLARPGSSPAERPVRLTLAAPSAQLHVRWDGAPVAVSDAGTGASAVERSAVSLGAHAVEVRQGLGCEVDPAPAWCGVTRAAITVPAGQGVHAADVALPPAPLRGVVVTEAGGGLLSLRVEGGPEPEAPRGAVQLELLPGRHAASATGAGCPPPPCGADCPPACARGEGVLEVPWAEGAWTTAIPLATVGAGVTSGAAVASTAPSTATTAAVVSGRAAPAETAPAQPASESSSASPAAIVEASARRSVRLRDLAAWLAQHPDWQPDAARAAGRADADYLKGWTGAAPPRLDDAAALATNPGLAAAYCAARGGLARVDAAPTSWTDGANAWHEWRDDGQGGVVSLQSSGQASPPVSASKTGKYTGFRCVR